MKRWNLLAASLIAATFVSLALLPLTRENLRFDMKMAAGKPVLGGVLADLGFKQDNNNPWLPPIQMSHDDTAAKSPELSVRVANAMQLSGREKWYSLQRIVADFPNDPAAHATLVRIACKSGGSVGVGHSAELDEIEGRPSSNTQASYTDPNDTVIMLRSCEAGERLDPNNAYFPAMAAIAYLSANEDDAARAALHRAASKSEWREYFDVEARGRIRRQELLYGPQNSLTETAALASLLFPHYTGLRGMSRVITVQAMHAEQAGDVKAGLAMRQDIAQLGATMQKQSSTTIGSLVGIAMIRVSESRPGGAEAIHSSQSSTSDSIQKDEQFLAYLTSHASKADVAHWQHTLDSADKTKTIIKEGISLSTFGSPMLFVTQTKLLVNLLLLSAATLLCTLAGLAYLRPWIGQRLGSAASRMVVTGFLVFLAWGIWQTIGNCRTVLLFGSIMQGFASIEDYTSPFNHDLEASVLRAFFQEVGIGVFAVLVPLTYLIVVAIQSRHLNHSKSQILQRWALPLAAFLTLGYTAHLVAFSLQEQTTRAELWQVVTHEGRHIAAKMGTTWPID